MTPITPSSLFTVHCADQPAIVAKIKGLMRQCEQLTEQNEQLRARIAELETGATDAGSLARSAANAYLNRAG
jgi:hypothetical protein